MNLLKQGFKENELQQQINEIFEIIQKWGQFHKFAFRLSIEASSSSQNKTVMQLSLKIRQKIANETNFPFDKKISYKSGSQNPERPQAIKQWIAELSEKETNKNWLRKALTCLIDNNIDEEQFELIHHVLSSSRKDRKKTDNPYFGYILLLENMFSEEHMSVNDVSILVDAFSIFEEKTDKLVSKCSNLELSYNQLLGEKSKLKNKLKNENDFFKKQLEEKDVKIRSLETEVEKKQIMLN